MAALDGDDAAWLASPDALPVLAAAAAAWHDARDPLRAAEQLRRDGVPARAAGLALTQVRLRERARARLGSIADRLLLTDDGLAQATRPVVARRRARRLAGAGVSHVADLGCGLGLDAAAMADAGLRVTAVERDPAIAALARANLAEVRGGGAVAVLDGDATATATIERLLAGGIDAAFVDPARRDPSGPRRADGSARRVTAPDSWSPPWSWIASLPDRVPAVAAKLAPGVPRTLAPGWETVWTSVDGDLVEAAVWSPQLARPGIRRAAVVVRTAAGDPATESRVVELTDADDPFGEDGSGGRAPCGPAGALLVEPDDAVLRAGLVGAVAARCDGWLLDPRLAIVSCDEPPAAELGARVYRVLGGGGTPLRRLRDLLVEVGAGDVVVKTRGVDTDPVRFRRGLALSGQGPTVTVLLARIGDGATAFALERLEGPARPAPAEG